MAFGDKKRMEEQRKIDYFLSHPMTEIIVKTIEELDWFHKCLGYNDDRNRIIKVTQYGVQIKSDNVYGDEALIDSKNIATKDIGTFQTYQSKCLPFYDYGYSRLADDGETLKCFAKAISDKVLALHSDYKSFEPDVRASDTTVELTIFIKSALLQTWDL